MATANKATFTAKDGIYYLRGSFVNAVKALGCPIDHVQVDLTDFVYTPLNSTKAEWHLPESGTVFCYPKDIDEGIVNQAMAEVINPTATEPEKEETEEEEEEA